MQIAVIGARGRILKKRFAHFAQSQPVADADSATQEEAAHLLHVRSSERTPHVPLNFNDARTAFETKSRCCPLKRISCLMTPSFALHCFKKKC